MTNVCQPAQKAADKPRIRFWRGQVGLGPAEGPQGRGWGKGRGSPPARTPSREGSWSPTLCLGHFKEKFSSMSMQPATKEKCAWLDWLLASPQGARRGGGPSAPETRGYRASSSQKGKWAVLEILQGLNSITAELASICLRPHWPVPVLPAPERPSCHLEGLPCLPSYSRPPMPGSPPAPASLHLATLVTSPCGLYTSDLLMVSAPCTCFAFFPGRMPSP